MNEVELKKLIEKSIRNCEKLIEEIKNPTKIETMFPCNLEGSYENDINYLEGMIDSLEYIKGLL